MSGTKISAKKELDHEDLASMNPRIRELLDKATCDILGVKQVDQKQFAELIIRECIAQCNDENSQQYIMSHFDMKESDWS